MQIEDNGPAPDMSLWRSTTEALVPDLLVFGNQKHAFYPSQVRYFVPDYEGLVESQLAERLRSRMIKTKPARKGKVSSMVEILKAWDLKYENRTRKVPGQLWI